MSPIHSPEKIPSPSVEGAWLLAFYLSLGSQEGLAGGGSPPRDPLLPTCYLWIRGLSLAPRSALCLGPGTG